MTTGVVLNRVTHLCRKRVWKSAPITSGIPYQPKPLYKTGNNNHSSFYHHHHHHYCGNQQALFSSLITTTHHSFAVVDTKDPTSCLSLSPRLQQVRWKGRNDGNRYQAKERQPTKKARKQYHRKLQKIQEEQSRHSKPGSKAGVRREFAAQMKQELLDQANELEGNELVDPNNLIAPDDEYGMGDALLDDLIGNTSYLSSIPTPEPVYIGHKHRKYYNRVAEQMEKYRKSVDLIKQEAQKGESSSSSPSTNTQLLDVAAATLPSDLDISLALRAFRDKNGTRSKPVGIVAALKHLIQDLGVPISAFDEYTYTTMLTCCGSVKEARRIFQMMKEQQVPITEYSWSILVDIHAKIGDYKGCVAVQQEMLQEGGIAPTLPSYTSLLAACYKVCIDGRVPHNVRAEAAKVGWEKWKEMRVVGIDPDTMAYGAILRLTSAVGQPEKALNLLQEMQQMQIKPTTLCFTSALRAVARSQSIAIRYEKGSSKKNRRREFLTQHHGKMAKLIVTMAENAEVEQDDGFVAALALCAAEAGDVATAKAIYVASQIRRLDQFRMIGPDSHLARLRGEANGDMMKYIGDKSYLPSGEKGELVEQASGSTLPAYNHKQKYPSFGEREYGKDNRALSAILHACARAVDKSGIGAMWQGRENEGYLCENSLRLLTARRVPQYTPDRIPGQKTTDNLTWDGEHMDKEDYRDGKREPRKFQGLSEDDSVGTNLNDLDEMFSRIYFDDEGQLKKEFQPTTPEDIWHMKYGSELESDSQQISGKSSILQIDDAYSKNDTILSQPSNEMYFDYDSMKWKNGKPGRETNTKVVQERGEDQDASIRKENTEKGAEIYYDMDTMKWKAKHDLEDNQEAKAAKAVVSLRAEDRNECVQESAGTELYFDDDEMRWKTRERAEEMSASFTDYESEILAKEVGDRGRQCGVEDGPGEYDVFQEDEFSIFFADLQRELRESGEEEVEEAEARELFVMMKDEYNEMMETDLKDLGLEGYEADPVGDIMRKTTNDFQLNDDRCLSSTTGAPSLSYPVLDEFEEQPHGDVMASGNKDSVATVLHLNSSVETANTGKRREGPEDVAGAGILNAGFDEKSWVSPDSFASSLESKDSRVTQSTEKSLEHHAASGGSESLSMQGSRNESDIEQKTLQDVQLAELQEILPAFSDKRLKRILATFHKSLGNPSILELVPIARERMPDYITATWLKQMSSLTAKYVVNEAAAEGVVDTHILNGVLELQTSGGSLDRAVEFHETQYEIHGFEPTAYSDRLVLQMFLKSQRLQRALAFKQKVAESGRTLDIKGYGSLIDYCGRHNQFGSAILLLKECISVHNAPPGEASLSKLRLLCRKSSIDVESVVELIGPDPVEWLRHGEANLKREMSKKGRRDVHMARNQLLRI